MNADTVTRALPDDSAKQDEVMRCVDAETDGFDYDGKRIFFVEPRGKDAGFERWRMCLYYERNSALTAFFSTEFGYKSFLHKAKKYTFAEWSDFRAFSDEKIPPTF